MFAGPLLVAAVLVLHLGVHVDAQLGAGNSFGPCHCCEQVQTIDQLDSVIATPHVLLFCPGGREDCLWTQRLMMEVCAHAERPALAVVDVPRVVESTSGPLERFGIDLRQVKENTLVGSRPRSFLDVVPEPNNADLACLVGRLVYEVELNRHG